MLARHATPKFDPADLPVVFLTDESRHGTLLMDSGSDDPVQIEFPPNSITLLAALETLSAQCRNLPVPSYASRAAVNLLWALLKSSVPIGDPSFTRALGRLRKAVRDAHASRGLRAPVLLLSKAGRGLRLSVSLRFFHHLRGFVGPDRLWSGGAAA